MNTATYAQAHDEEHPAAVDDCFVCDNPIDPGHSGDQRISVTPAMYAALRAWRQADKEQRRIMLSGDAGTWNIEEWVHHRDAQDAAADVLCHLVFTEITAEGIEFMRNEERR